MVAGEEVDWRHWDCAVKLSDPALIELYYFSPTDEGRKKEREQPKRRKK